MLLPRTMAVPVLQGVHIADVASFIPPFSALDVEAGMRATSTYLVQRVIPMLPRLLCEELCRWAQGGCADGCCLWDLCCEERCRWGHGGAGRAPPVGLALREERAGRGMEP